MLPDSQSRRFAHVRGGRVVAVEAVPLGQPRPFLAIEMRHPRRRIDPLVEHVVEVTGVPCEVGFIADAWGNVGSPGTRQAPLTKEEPAYHDRHTLPARTGAEALRNYR